MSERLKPPLSEFDRFTNALAADIEHVQTPAGEFWRQYVSGLRRERARMETSQESTGQQDSPESIPISTILSMYSAVLLSFRAFEIDPHFVSDERERLMLSLRKSDYFFNREN